MSPKVFSRLSWALNINQSMKRVLPSFVDWHPRESHVLMPYGRQSELRPSESQKVQCSIKENQGFKKKKKKNFLGPSRGNCLSFGHVHLDRRQYTVMSCGNVLGRQEEELQTHNQYVKEFSDHGRRGRISVGSLLHLLKSKKEGEEKHFQSCKSLSMYTRNKDRVSIHDYASCRDYLERLQISSPTNYPVLCHELFYSDNSALSRK